MALGYVTGLRNNQLDEITALLDAGSGAGKLRIYSGSRPATGGAETTVLAELPLSDPAAGAAAAAALTLSAITADSSANNTGTATWFRLMDSDNNAVIDGDVGTSGSDLNLNSTSITAGGTVSVTSFVISAGNP